MNVHTASGPFRTPDEVRQRDAVAEHVRNLRAERTHLRAVTARAAGKAMLASLALWLVAWVVVAAMVIVLKFFGPSPFTPRSPLVTAALLLTMGGYLRAVWRHLARVRPRLQKCVQVPASQPGFAGMKPSDRTTRERDVRALEAAVETLRQKVERRVRVAAFLVAIPCAGTLLAAVVVINSHMLCMCRPVEKGAAQI